MRQAGAGGSAGGGGGVVGDRAAALVRVGSTHPSPKLLAFSPVGDAQLRMQPRECL